MGQGNLLETIVDATRLSVRERKNIRSSETMERIASSKVPRGKMFVAGFRRPDRFNIIAECKRRSPSHGVLRDLYDPAKIALDYESTGAAAISVLTEPAFFDGALSHLECVRRTVEIPVLRKDFIVSRYQLVESLVHGADAVLLIVAALTQAKLAELLTEARSMGLAALVEVHSRMELMTALGAGARLVGVNNRNLKTLEVDLQVSKNLIEMIPEDVVAISESGIRSAADLISLRKLGFSGFLIGGSFMKAANPGIALGKMVSELTAISQEQ